MSQTGRHRCAGALAGSAAAAAEALLALCFVDEARRLAVDLPGMVQAAVQLAGPGRTTGSGSPAARAAALRLLAVLTREPAACEALARRTHFNGGGSGDVLMSGLSSIPLDVALHALLQWSCDPGPAGSCEAAVAADARTAAAIVLSNVADAAAAATQGPGRFKAVTEAVRLQVCCFEMLN